MRRLATAALVVALATPSAAGPGEACGLITDPAHDARSVLPHGDLTSLDIMAADVEWQASGLVADIRVAGLRPPTTASPLGQAYYLYVTYRERGYALVAYRGLDGEAFYVVTGASDSSSDLGNRRIPITGSFDAENDVVTILAEPKIFEAEGRVDRGDVMYDISADTWQLYGTEERQVGETVDRAGKSRGTTYTVGTRTCVSS